MEKFKNFVKQLFSYTSKKKYEFDLNESPLENNNEDNFQNGLPPLEDTNESIFNSLHVNLEYVKSKYNFLINSDIKIREFHLTARNKQYSAFLLYIDGLVDSNSINHFILDPLMLKNKANTFDNAEDVV